MCDCYRIDHPGADPDCEAHGVIATQERERLEARIAELEEQVRQLRGQKLAERPRRVYEKFNINCEEARLRFYADRDGLDAAIDAAKRLIKTYLQASLSSRQKFNTRGYTYRHGYVESAYSIRHLLQTKFLEKLA